ncbi:hypothetical protein [Spartinivicinus ruber]|uniref:hypothetical protein n=1 Tax=Spartinivicinus ruber TaxID=2683272 RepID=UPI0013D2FF63|nr:hypothetical protein [Spartinivicinus ruber]
MPHQLETYSKDLTQERLEFIANEIISVVGESQNDCSTENDTPYTQGTNVFGRVKKKFENLGDDPEIEWINMARTTNDYVIKVGDTPIEVVQDDYQNPQKQHRFKGLNKQAPGQLTLKLEDPIEKVTYWWIFINKPENELDKLVVSFIGYTENYDMLCEWHSDRAGGPIVNPVDLPEPKLIEDKPLKRTKRKRKEKDNDDE